MALVLNDRVRETTAVTGTGSATLLGAVTGYQSFSTIGNGNTTYYTIADQGGPNWEVGLGTYSSGTLARTTVLSSSNSGSLVNFTAGTKDVFVTQPSEKAVYLDGSGNITPSSVGPLTVSSLTDSGLTSGRVTYAGTAGLLQDSANLTFNGTILTANTLNLTNALTTAYGGTGLTSFTAGDLPYYSTGTALSKLAIGTNGYILQSNGSAPTWVLASSVIGGAGGSNTQVQYNSSGLLAGSANLTFNGTTLTTANDASISGLTVGKGGGSVSTNTAFGTSALTSNTSGANNQAFGSGALSSNTTGGTNSAFAQQSLGSNTTGNSNSAFGYQALVNNTTASNNTAVGYQAGYILTGGNSTAVGYQAIGSGSATGGNCDAFGYRALYSLTSGTFNTGLGYQALGFTTTGSNNIAVGFDALFSNTTASNNTAVGYQSLQANTTAGSCVAVGYQAGYNSNAGGNTFVGETAGYGVTSGNYNTAIGRRVMYGGTVTGLYNTAVGGQDDGNVSTMTSLTTGGKNTAVGNGALSSNTTASNNTAVGYQALYTSTTSTGNTAFGYQALYSHNGAGGSYLNCAVGYKAGYAITGGYVNTIIGADSTANSLTSGAYNTYIGTCDASSGAVTLELVVAATNPKVTGKGTSTAFITANGGSTYNGANSTLWAITSDQRLKKNIVDNNNGLSKILPIQVRNFEYRTKDEVTELEPQNAIDIKGVQLGTIAQELQAILPDCVKTESTGVMSVDASNITWYLINAVKELNAKITALENK